MKAALYAPICSMFLALAHAAETPDDPLANLEELMSVRIQTASLRKQKLQDAPANVTVVSAEDIRRFGYRTLGDVLQNVRSFYNIRDGAFTFPGVRGFGILGDYNMRFLVMVNGHRMTDVVYGAMYLFGQEFPLDMSLVEQIEIVRGPSSALYGSNGLFATINIITRAPQASPAVDVALETGSFGEKKVTASTSLKAGSRASLLLAGSAFHTQGRSLALPGNPGDALSARNFGNEQGFHAFSNLVYGNWNLTALFGSRRTAVSSGWYGATIGDTGTTDLEGRNFVEAAWSRQIRASGEVKWRAYYDQFRYDGVYRYDGTEGYTSLDGAMGDWIGTDVSYLQEFQRFGALTVGGELKHELRNTQYTTDYSTRDQPFSSILRVYPDSAYGVFAQHELKLSPVWSLYAGGRLDDSRRNSPYFSPRIALVGTKGSSTNKFLYGRAFRNPSTFERYWKPNPELEAEAIDTVEFVNEHAFGTRANLITSAYHYRVSSLIEGVPVNETDLQYRNTNGASATGAEIELTTRLAQWLDTSTAFTIQRNRRAGSDNRLANSPVKLGFFRAAVPMRGMGSTFSGTVRYVGSRLDAYASKLPAYVLADCTISTDRLARGVSFQFGIRNLLDHRYQDPMSPEHALATLPGNGRTWFVRLSWSPE